MEVGGKLYPASGVERDSRPPTWGIGHRALVTLTHAPCPIPHAQKLHPLVGGVFYWFWGAGKSTLARKLGKI